MRGIRHGGAGDSDPAFARQGARPPEGLFRQPDFRAGFDTYIDVHENVERAEGLTEIMGVQNCHDSGYFLSSSAVK